MPRVLITGATGLVGRALCPLLAEAGYVLRAALRGDAELPLCIAERVIVGEICQTTEWGSALVDVDMIVHAAARAHVPDDPPENQGLYEAVNAHGTRQLAQAAASAGVRWFVYLSSIKVHGDATGQRPYEATDLPNPVDDYANAKLQGERYVQQAAAASSMEAVVVRPPLVYGPGVRANFLRLMHWVDREFPLPFGAICNRRSLVSVWNLNELIVSLLTHPDAAGRTWLVSDGEDLSTPELVRRIARALGRRAHLPRVPPRLLRACGHLARRDAELSRLTGSLVVDASPARRLLEWRPVVSVDEGLTRTAAWYRTLWAA
jgi:nucleoside-diphosphate-sugar epimerase